MRKLTVTVDKNANLKALKRLEAKGLVELFAVGIEGLEDTNKIANKELPLAVFDSKFSLIGKCRIGDNELTYGKIERIVGKHNHGDCLHLESHIASKRDIFVTDDNDFLSCRNELAAEFGVEILTVAQLIARFPPEGDAPLTPTHS